MNTQAQWEKDFWDTRINEGETLAELFSGGDMHNLDFAKEIINPLVQQAILNARDELEQKNYELADALLDMYGQYCGGGHDFMSAGERASTVLEMHGYANFDEVGRIVVGNISLSALNEEKE